MLAIHILNKAQDDYRQLDGSQKKWVSAAIKRCAKADGLVGDQLSNNSVAKLHGCKKLKNNKLGLRIIFRLNNHQDIEVIEIIIIDKREDFKVYKEAEKRLNEITSTFKKWTTEN